MRERDGVFYPVEIAWIFSNSEGTRRHVVWNASWIGGAFLVLKTAKGYEVRVLSSWVT